jgi:methionyl aminopeptidase
MVQIRSEKEIDLMREACRIAADSMAVARDELKPGMTTKELADKIQAYIESNEAKAAFLGYHGFPGAACISINEEVVHGIPGERVIEAGDLVKVDVGTFKNGFYGDLARTFKAGAVSVEAEALSNATEESLYEGIKNAVEGNRVGDIGHAVQEYVEPKGYGVVRMLVGHGIGRKLHEDPQIPNYGPGNVGAMLRNGMALAIEPMINLGTWEVDTLDDGWTVVTSDGKVSAHFENTCIIRNSHPEILTLLDGEEKWQKMIL